MDFLRHTSKDVVGYSKMIHDLKWNSEGNYIGLVSADKTVKVGQLDKTGSFQNVHSIPNSAQMTQIHWNPQNDSRIGMCGDDKAVELWDVRASRASVKLASSGNNISIAWSPCGMFVAVGNKNDLVQVYDVRTSAVCSKKRFSYEVNDLVWTGNSNYFLAATGGDGVGSVDILSLLPPDRTTENNHTSSSNSSSSSSSSAAAATTATASAVGELQLIERVSAHVGNCLGMRVDTLKQRLAVGSLDHCVSLWELNDMICTHTINMESEVRGMSFSGDGCYLAVVAEDPHVTICDSETGEVLTRVATRQKLNSLAWHPSQSLLCVAAEDKSASPQYLRFIRFA